LVRRIAVRKILKAREAIRSVVMASIVSLALSMFGLLTYTLIVRSDVVLMEAFVWLIEALSFGGLAIAFKIAASRTVTYRARYEILRLESLAALIVSIIAMIVTGSIAYDAVVSPHGEPTPAIVSLYPLLSAAASYGLDTLLYRRASGYTLRLVSLRAVSSKLRYDVLFEIAGGAGILASNALHTGVIEALTLVVVGSYVIYGLALIAAEHMLYLVGPGPHYRRLELRVRIRDEARRLGLRVARSRVEVYGTFAEAEVWIPLDPASPLSEAHKRARELARHLVHTIPELLRVVVVPIPSQTTPSGGKRYTRKREEKPGGTQGKPRGGGEPSTSGGRARSP